VEPHQIRCRLVFLNVGQEVEVPVDAQTIQHFSLKFRESVQRMRELLVNAAANTPLDSAQFPMTEELSQCARCAFRRACGREGVTFASLKPPEPAAPSVSAA